MTTLADLHQAAAEQAVAAQSKQADLLAAVRNSDFRGHLKLQADAYRSDTSDPSDKSDPSDNDSP